MKSGQKPVRYYLSRTIMASIVALVIPLGSAFAITGYNTGIRAGFSYSEDNYVFLASYGTWTNVAPYGQVWVPTQAPDWRPFLNGQWVWTTGGWAWSSDEPFGWLVYHYGHWNYRQDVGWYWIPGDTWSPAAVVWLSTDDYAFWAPSPPVGVYWPQPWVPSPFGFNIWIGARLRDFDRDDIGFFRLHRFPRREEFVREHLFSGPPNIVVAQSFIDHPIITHFINRDRDFAGFRSDRDFGRDFIPFGNHFFGNRFEHRKEFRDREFHGRQNSFSREPNTPWGSPPQPLGHIGNGDIQRRSGSQNEFNHQGHFEGGRSHSGGHQNAGHGNRGGHADRGRGR